MSHPSGSATQDALSRPWIIERPRLIKTIEDSSARVVVLFGPAGYGKTTLARQLAKAHQVVWYGCRPSTTDVAKLAHGLSVAFANALSSDTSALKKRLLVTPKPAAESGTLASLVLDAVAAATSPPDLWLVIDDYQWLLDDPGAEEFIGTLAAAESFRTVITTRVRPRWVSARSLLYGDYLEIDARDLAMTADEVTEMFRRLDRAPPEHALTLANGWPAVVSLVAFTDVDKPLALTGALEEFVANEVYSNLDGEVRRSLIALAALPTSDRAMAEAIIGDAELAAAIKAGERCGILAEDHEGRLEIHPLVAELLRDRKRFRPESELKAVLERAARLYIESRQWDEAFELIDTLRDRDLFEALLSEGLRASLKEGRTSSVERWIDIAEREHWEIAALDVAAAEVALRDGLYIRAEALSAALAERTTKSPERTWARLVAGRAAHLAGKEEEALKHYRDARHGAVTPDDARVAAWGELTTATDLELPGALELLKELEGSQLARPDDQLQLACRRLNVGSRFGTLHVLSQVREAGQLLPFVDDPLLRTSFLNQLAYVSALAGEYELALSAVDQMFEESQRHRIQFVMPYAQFARAVVFVAKRRFREAFDLLKLAREEGERTNDTFVIASCAAIRSRALIALGAFDEAAAVAAHNGGRIIKSMRAELLVTRALASACLGASDSTAELVRQARELSRTVEVPVTATCAEAVVASRSGADASELAAEAARLARQTNYVDGLIAAYRGYPELARLIAAKPDHRSWLAGVMSEADDHDLLRIVGISRRGHESSHLSRREAEVFQLLRRGLTNKEIAKELYITEATAKIHVRHICEKLGVKTRTEAVLRTPAEDLGDLN